MKKFTAIVLVFCMLAAALITGLSVFAAENAGATSGETQTLASVNSPTAFVQFKETESTFSARVVVAAPQTTMNVCSSASMVVSFITADGKTVTSGSREVNGLYRNIKADGDTYTAAENNVLFGVVVTGVPYGTKSVSATLTTKTGETSQTVEIGFSNKLPAEKTYTVTELLNVAEIKNLGSGAFTAQQYTAKGKVTEANGDRITIADDTNSILIYKLDKSDLKLKGIPDIEVGDVITVQGYIQNYQGSTIEFSGDSTHSNPLCIAKEGLDKFAAPTHGLFKPVTSQEDITEDYYLFGVQNKDDVTKSHVMNSKTMDNANSVEIPIYDEGIYAEDGGQYLVKLVPCGDGFAIQLPNGLYLQGGTSNGLYTSNEPVEHSIEFASGKVTFKDTTKGTDDKVYLKYNTSQPRFVYYGSGQQNFTLFKLDEDAEYTTHTVTFMSGAAVYARQTVIDGKKATEPAGSPKMDGKGFDGWYTNDSETEFDFDNTPITEDVTLYAHFTESTGTVKQFEKVTDLTDLEEGQYLIVYENGTKARVYEGIDTTGQVEKDTDGSVIAYSDDLEKYLVEIKAYNGGYSIKITAGTHKDTWLNHTGSSNTTIFSKTEVKLEISFDVKNGALIKASDGYYFRYNSSSGQERFRFFRQSGGNPTQSPVSIYKLVGGSN